MSEENLHKQKFKVEQWPTSKVTLYPTRASIVRIIEGVQLKAGLNEITISNLTSVADPDSIRVSGTTDDHPARINDLTIDTVLNTDTVHDNDLDDSDSDEEDWADEDSKKPASLKTAEDDRTKVNSTIAHVKERQGSASKELAFLEQYASTVASSAHAKSVPDPKTMKDTLELYNSQRATHYEVITTCAKQLVDLEKERARLNKVITKEKKAFDKAIRQDVEAREKRQAERDERKREKKENKPEKSTHVYRVRITIELPASEFATSVESSKADEAKPLPEVFQEAKLTLTYTTASASWTPHYDLRLDTTNPSLSTLTYRAHFTNRTYETWSHAALTLSTSEASFGGLNEKIPQMQGWRVSLTKKYNTTSGENGLWSLAELKARQEAEEKEYGHDIAAIRRGERMDSSHGVVMARTSARKSRRMGSSIAFKSASPAPPMVLSRSIQAQPTAYGQAQPTAMAYDPTIEDAESEYEAEDVEAATLAAGGQAMQHSLAGSDTYGFTTTYELPTPRTIPSSPLVRRHVIAEIPLPSLVFTHIVIPKLKAAAFLKAKVINTSAVPLLPGQAGMTLDGSYMGNLKFPRCSPSETVVLELGVDQSVKVEYERPTVKHGTQGMMIMGKEEVGAYKRAMRITNSKSSTVSLVVLDQIPVPEDDRLKVNILVPKGLKDVDDVVKNGVGVDGKPTSNKGAKKLPVLPPSSFKQDDSSETGTKNKAFSLGRRDSLRSTQEPSTPKPVAGSSNGKSGSAWGTAKASLKKNGEVRWDVDLNKGGCVALALEWECRMPGGEGVHAIS